MCSNFRTYYIIYSLFLTIFTNFNTVYSKPFNKTSIRDENLHEKLIYDMELNPHDTHEEFTFLREAFPQFLNKNSEKDRQQSANSTMSSEFDGVDTSSKLFKQQSKTLFDSLQLDDSQKFEQNFLNQDIANFYRNRKNNKNNKDQTHSEVSYYYIPTKADNTQVERKTIETYSENFLNQLSSENIAILGRIKTINQEKCRAKLFNQTISVPGCEQRVIRNRFCYGRCNSFYIPLDGSQEQFRFKTCSACKPIKSQKISVSLKCYSPHMSKRTVLVEKVERCRCKAETFQYKNFIPPSSNR